MTAALVVDKSVEVLKSTRDENVQRSWAKLPISKRLLVLRRLRHILCSDSASLLDAFPPHLSRTRVDSQVAEILPLLSACKFLEDRAEQILRSKKLGQRGRPFWLRGVKSVVERAPFGQVLIIGPANYPLFLAGVQTLQAIVSGNSAVWKPGLGGEAVANVFARAFAAAGLPAGLLRVTDDSAEAGIAEVKAKPDKIFFTGSAATGRGLLKAAAETVIPAVVELSGCDAVVVLPSANMSRVVDALAFGMRLNGSATCMAPRRLILVGRGHESLLRSISERFESMDGVIVGEPTKRLLGQMLMEARAEGAVVQGNLWADLVKPLLVLNGNPRMRIAQADVFAPILTVIEVADVDEAFSADQFCPYGLTMSIFGEEKLARKLARRVAVGSVIVNDLIVPSADPRVPFVGRRSSGFGATRGAEGLLEMSTPKVIAIRRGESTRHYQPTFRMPEAFFEGIIRMTHGASISDRIKGLGNVLRVAKKLK